MARSKSIHEDTQHIRQHMATAKALEQVALKVTDLHQQLLVQHVTAAQRDSDETSQYREGYVGALPNFSGIKRRVPKLHQSPASSSVATPADVDTTAAVAEKISSLKQKLKELKATEKKREEANKMIAKATNQVNELRKVRNALVNANPMAKERLKRLKKRKQQLKKEIGETIQKVLPVVGENEQMKMLKDSVGHCDEE